MKEEEWVTHLEEILQTSCQKKKFSKEEITWLDCSPFGFTIGGVPEIFFEPEYYRWIDSKYLTINRRQHTFDPSCTIEIYKVDHFCNPLFSGCGDRIGMVGDITLYAPNEEGEGYYSTYDALNYVPPLLRLFRMVESGKMHYRKGYDDPFPGFSIVKALRT